MVEDRKTGEWQTTGNFFRVIILVTTLIGISIQYSTQQRCDFAVYKEDESKGVGVWYLQIDGTCEQDIYNPNDTDTFLNVARYLLSFSMLCAAAGAISVAFQFCCCGYFASCCFDVSAYMVAWILAACTNALFGSELCVGNGFDDGAASGLEVTAGSQNLCTLGYAAGMNAATTVLYMICCLVLCCAPEPEPLWKQQK